MINHEYYKNKFHDEYKNSSISELEWAINQNLMTGGDGKGRLATVPLIKDEVLSKLLKYRRENL